MPKVKMNIISEADAREKKTFTSDTDGPSFTGNGDVDLLCGKCGKLLGRGVPKGTRIELVIKCKDCGSYNEQPLD